MDEWSTVTALFFAFLSLFSTDRSDRVQTRWEKNKLPSTQLYKFRDFFSNASFRPDSASNTKKGDKTSIVKATKEPYTIHHIK